MASIIPKTIILHYQGDFEKGLFDPISRDNCTEPFLLLRDNLTKLGYTVEAPSDQDFENCHAVLFWDTVTLPFSFSNFSFSASFFKKAIKAFVQRIKGIKTRNWIKEAIRHQQENKLVLILWEGKVVCKDNFDPRFHRHFSRILTWDDHLVDGKRFFKMALPSPEKTAESPVIAFSEKKLLVNISVYKNSGRSAELYSERIKAIRYFESKKPADFDLYGYGWDALNNTKKSFSSYRGVVKNKWDILPKYKFAICYENNAGHRGYITEKIFDCLRADCVPVYWGATNIEEYVNPACYIDRRQFRSYEELDDYISRISEAEYLKLREAGKAFLQTDAFRKFLSPAFAETMIRVIIGEKAELNPNGLSCT